MHLLDKACALDPLLCDSVPEQAEMIKKLTIVSFILDVILAARAKGWPCAGTLAAASISQRTSSDYSAIAFETMTIADTVRMARAEELYRSSAHLCRVDRGDVDEFALYLQSWNGVASAAIDDSGAMVG